MPRTEHGIPSALHESVNYDPLLGAVRVGESRRKQPFIVRPNSKHAAAPTNEDYKPLGPFPVEHIV